MSELLDPRRHIAALLESVADGTTSSAEARTQFRTIAGSADDANLRNAFHFLEHFHFDEDIRARDLEYAQSQKQTLRHLAARLRSSPV